MRSRAALVALLLIGACRSEPKGVTVTEADPVGFPSASDRYWEGDTTYADSSLFADSLAADSVARGPVALADSTPDFGAFWSVFQAAVRSGRGESVAALAEVGPGGIARGNWPEALETVTDDPFRDPLLDLEPREVSRDGAARVARATVGFDAAGNVVPQDEADSDATVTLRFELVDNAWRLVRVGRSD